MVPTPRTAWPAERVGPAPCAYDTPLPVLAPGLGMSVVSEQFVKPVTRRAGGMSWALMMHPEGLPCDLFITHCWREGVFELVSKVLHSWPLGARGAYCCVLSNPQCLDIESLLEDPRKSPFAV